MNKDDLKKYKTKLEAELKTLEAELGKIGRKNPDHPQDWEAKPDDTNVLAADDGEVADKLESYEENEAMMSELEPRHEEVEEALARIKDGTYGICKVCKKPIEKARLEANPAAATCIEHKDK